MSADEPFEPEHHRVAELRGCDLAERARRMIAIAAPQFRDALLHASRSGEA